MKKLALIGIVFLAVFLLNCSEAKQEKTEAESESAPAIQAETASLTWVTNVEDAVAKAKTENKMVFINFTGSDWCKWCIKLDGEVFSQKEFVEYAKNNLVLVKLDFPKTIEQSSTTKEYNNTKMKKYGVRGFPTIILLNGAGEQVGDTGYKDGGPVKYVEHLKAFAG